MDLAVKKVQERETFVYVLDNIDWMEKVHDMRSDAQNKSVHAVATSLVFDRISSKDLPDDGPKRDLNDCNMKELVTLTDEEKNLIKERYKLLVAKILCQYFPAFKFLQDLVPVHLLHENTEAMTRKSTVVPFPVLMKDEKKYSEVVNVLDQLETMTSIQKLVFAQFLTLITNPPNSKAPLHGQINQPRIPDLPHPPLTHYKILKSPAMVISYLEYGLLVQKTRDLTVIRPGIDVITFIHFTSLTGTPKEAFLR